MSEETLKMLATGRTTSGDVEGSATSSTALEPTIWLKEIVDAAQQQWFFLQSAYMTRTQPGSADVVVPYRKKYLGDSGVSSTTSTPVDGTRVTATRLDNLDGVTLTPTLDARRVSIGNFELRKNNLNLMREAQAELVYAIGEKVDQNAATVIGQATSTTSTTSGSQILFGGDATSDATLAAGDVITTDLVADAKKLLVSRRKQYRASTGAGGGYGAIQSGGPLGNPWSFSDGRFILYVGPAQANAFEKDSQFVNAAEYGGREVLLNGEVGRLPYLGVTIVVTNNVEQILSGADSLDAEKTAVSVDFTRCILLVSQKAHAFAWGQEPTLSFFNNVPEVSQEIVIESAYQSKVVQADAIVFADVANS